MGTHRDLEHHSLGQAAELGGGGPQPHPCLGCLCLLNPGAPPIMEQTRHL